MAKKGIIQTIHNIYTFLHTTIEYLVQVKSQLSKAFEPALTSVEVLWQQFDDNAPKPIQVIDNTYYILAIVYVLTVKGSVILYWIID